MFYEPNISKYVKSITIVKIKMWWIWSKCDSFVLITDEISYPGCFQIVLGTIEHVYIIILSCYHVLWTKYIKICKNLSRL